MEKRTNFLIEEIQIINVGTSEIVKQKITPPEYPGIGFMLQTEDLEVEVGRQFL